MTTLGWWVCYECVVYQQQEWMSDRVHPPQMEGLGQCFHNFEGTYCTRKLVEFLLSVVWLGAGTLILGIFVRKYRASRPFWLITILGLIVLSLIVNIFFCFFNLYYWMYAMEDFLYSMQYLILVSYVCYAYVLKHSSLDKDDLMTKLNANLNQEEPKFTHKAVFSVVVGLLIALYFSIFITSVVWEVKYDREEYKADPNNGIRYCQETWYLVLNVICVVLSVVVVVVMLKSQNEEYDKLVEFSQDEGRRENGNITSSDGESSFKVTNNNRSYSHVSSSLLTSKINNPFRNLWIWVGVNVLSQVMNLVQSGIMLKATPPLCYIVTSNQAVSDMVSMVFFIFTLYMGYGATIWYVGWVKILQSKTNIDRTVLYSAELDIEGNIELFVPSKEQTISFQ